MRSVAATLAGGAAATLAVLISVAFRGRVLKRAGNVSARAWTATVAALLASAAVEELVFRVGVVTALDHLVSTSIAVSASALLFALPHLVRGDTRAERFANVVTAAAFGVVTALLWVRRRDRQTPVWPFAQSVLSHSNGASAVLTAGAEITAIAATGIPLLALH